MTIQLVPADTTIGIVGGGQLGRMLATAALRLGFRTHVFANNNDEPALAVCNDRTISSFNDSTAIEEFAKNCDVVTFEFENISVDVLRKIELFTPVYPKLQSLAITQDRLHEKQFLVNCGFNVAPFSTISDTEDIEKAFRTIGTPCILKTRKFGYDGKGQRLACSIEDIKKAWLEINKVPCLLEGKVDFMLEISSIIARTNQGKTEEFEISENQHKDGILRTSKVPANISNNTRKIAKKIAHEIIKRIEHVGVLAVEMFVSHDGTVLVNELAPRVHNSGHWTIDACITDQFEQHIRAICGLPLGKGCRHSDAIMTNLIGNDVSSAVGILSDSTAKLHLYGKKKIKPGRKMGHVTRLIPR